MTKFLGIFLLLSVICSVLFRGLFFPAETYVMFSALSLVCLAYFIIKLVKGEKFYFDRGLVILNLTLVSAYGLSFVTAVYPRGNVDSILQYALFFIVSTVIFDLAKSHGEKIIGFFSATVALVGFGISIIGLAGYTKAFPFLMDTLFSKRLGSTFQYTNTAGIFLLFSYLITISLILNTKRPIFSGLLGGIGSTALIALFFTGSRGSFVFTLIGAAALLIAIPWAEKPRCLVYLIVTAFSAALSVHGYGTNAAASNPLSATKWVGLSFVVSAAIIFVFNLSLRLKLKKKTLYTFILTSIILFTSAALVFTYQRYQPSGSIGNLLAKIIPSNIADRLGAINFREATFIARLDMDRDALKLIKENWLTGYGGGGWTALYQSIQGYFYTARAVHNHYLQVFVEAGIAGFLSFLGLTLLSLYYLLKSRLKCADQNDRVYVAGILSAFLVIAGHSAMDFNLSYGSMALIWWSILAFCAFYHSKTGIGDSRNRNAAVLESRGPVMPVAAAALCLAMAVGAGLFANGARYDSMAADSRDHADLLRAEGYYEKALEYDSTNASYLSALAEVYHRLALNSEKTADKDNYMKKALYAGEKSIRYDPDYPYYNYVLTLIYFDTEQYIKAGSQAERLFKLQPMHRGNYELLARGYLEAGLQYYRKNNIPKARELIEKCSEIGKMPNLAMNPTIAFYQGKAMLLEGRYQEAEKLLDYARGGSPTLKMDSDRLLYIINEETGREKENDKYRYKLWMGMVKKTPVYKEVKQILHTRAFFPEIEK